MLGFEVRHELQALALMVATISRRIVSVSSNMILSFRSEVGGEWWSASVFLGQKERGGFTMAVLTNGLGDTPNLGPVLQMVGRQQPTSIDEGLFVGLAVLLAKVAPVPCKMTLQELERGLSVLLKRFQQLRALKAKRRN